MKKTLLLTTLIAGASLAACHRHPNSVDYVRETRVPTHHEGGSYNAAREERRHEDRNHDNIVDTHHEFVTGLGFENVINENGHTYHNRYRLDARHAADDTIFHQWRHTWMEPNEFLDKDIEVYRYTGEYEGEKRHIYVISHKGEVLGGYHHGVDETIENARILKEGTYTSRLGEDFRETWDDLFNINR